MRYLKTSTIALGLALGATVLLASRHEAGDHAESGDSFGTPVADREASFIRTAATASFDTDFTAAAEKTVNEVVCIKSFTSRRQQGYGGSGLPSSSASSRAARTVETQRRIMCRAASVRV